MNRLPWGWSIIHIALLLLLFTPFGMFSLCLLMVPPVVQFVRTKPPVFAALFVLNAALAYTGAALLGWGAGGLSLVLLAFFFLIPAIVMGILYRRQKPATSVITGGVVGLLAVILLMFVILFLMGINIMGQMKTFLTESMTMTENMMELKLPKDAIETVIRYATQIIPFGLITFSTICAAITHGIARSALARAGVSVPRLKPVRTWMLPKPFVWYYLIALALSFFFVQDDGSTLSVLLLNLIPLLTVVFVIQAISFLFFVADLKRWNRKAVVGILIAAGFFFLFAPPILQIFALLGIFDVAFPIRDRLNNSN